MPPPVPPTPVGTYMLKTPSPTVVIEVFLDLCGAANPQQPPSAPHPTPPGCPSARGSQPFRLTDAVPRSCCPFSKKMADVLHGEVMPALQAGGKVDTLFQSVPQPWHPQSTWMHEVSLAVKALDESKFYAATAAIFAVQEKFFDSEVEDKSRKQILTELAAVVAPATGLEASAVLAQVALAGEGNKGSATTQQIKWAVKYHRCRGIHVTPTVLLNGLEAPDVSSGWTAEQ